jgi:hypothetical protein
MHPKSSAEKELIERIKASEEDLRQGRTISLSESRTRIKRLLDELYASKNEGGMSDDRSSIGEERAQG